MLREPIALAQRETERGVTLLEILVASIVGVLLAGGTMMAFVMSKKVSANAAGRVEAADLAQQTLERFRNRIACDDAWFTASTCAPGPGLPTGWTSDVLPVGSSLLAQGGARQYRVTPRDCDGDGATGDCFQVENRITWSPPQ